MTKIILDIDDVLEDIFKQAMKDIQNGKIPKIGFGYSEEEGDNG